MAKPPLLSTALLPEYLLRAPDGLQNALDALQDAPLSTPAFSFYTSVASVFSSKIEGEQIELDSYIKHKRQVRQIAGKVVSAPETGRKGLVVTERKNVLPTSLNILQQYRGTGFGVSGTRL